MPKPHDADNADQTACGRPKGTTPVCLLTLVSILTLAVITASCGSGGSGASATTSTSQQTGSQKVNIIVSTNELGPGNSSPVVVTYSDPQPGDSFHKTTVHTDQELFETSVTVPFDFNVVVQGQNDIAAGGSLTNRFSITLQVTWVYSDGTTANQVNKSAEGTGTKAAVISSSQ
jgi:hypothetical protein